jgi:hypothetical protein
LAEEGGKYTRSSLVMGLNFLFFFLGVLVIDVNNNTLWFNYALVIFTFFIALFVAIGLSFLNRSLIGGMIIGLSFSGSYWVGFLTGLLIKFQFTSNTDVLKYFGPYALYVSTAFSALGLFFGLLGFMTERLFVENPVIETYIFRDYWSNVFSLGKNNRREMQQLDQKMTRAHIMAKDWWRQQIHRVKQTKPELIYVNETTAKIKGESTTREEKIGDVFDIASGQRLYDDVVDPSDLIGVYRPSILSIPAISNRIGGGRRLALEELVTRFLGWFIKSKALWVSYLAVSILFTYSLLNYFEGLVHTQGGVLMETDRQSLIITSVFLSALTIYFVFRFHGLSLELFDKRPDERTLVFSIYLILYLFYGLYHQVIVSIDQVMLNQASLFDVGPVPWIISIEWLGFFTVILALAYIFIHRESEISNVYLYDDRTNTDSQNPIASYKDATDKPYWLKHGEETNLYWVLRFMYFWRYELSVIPHPDWERVEVWVDAKTGDAKWIVSDYHYRELWYKVEGDLRNKGLHVGFLTNFHTPIPFVTSEEINTFTSVLEQSKKALLNIFISGKIEIGEMKKISYSQKHPPGWIEKYGLTGLAANFCSNLNWCYWRYPWGIDNYTKYLTYPSTVIDEQPLQ